MYTDMPRSHISVWNSLDLFFISKSIYSYTYWLICRTWSISLSDEDRLILSSTSGNSAHWTGVARERKSMGFILHNIQFQIFSFHHSSFLIVCILAFQTLKSLLWFAKGTAFTGSIFLIFSHLTLFVLLNDSCHLHK